VLFRSRLTREALRDGFGGPGIYRIAEAQAAGPTEDSLIWPTYYVEPELGPDIHQWIVDLIAGDQRFFCADPNQDLTDYNYRENPTLVEAIRAGHRGAYWDILRRLQENLPPL
jgi:hypothetical protein